MQLRDNRINLGHFSHQEYVQESKLSLKLKLIS